MLLAGKFGSIGNREQANGYFGHIFDQGLYGTLSYGTSKVDTSGNVYTLMYMLLTNPGPGEYYRIYLTKHNSSGVKQWERRIYSVANSKHDAMDIAINPASATTDIFITFKYRAGEIWGLAMYNNSGTIQWQREITLTNTSRGAKYHRSSVSYNVTTGLVCASMSHLFAATDIRTIAGVWNTSGVNQDLRYLYKGANSYVEPTSVTQDASGNIYWFVNYDTTTTSSRAVLMKFNSSYVLQWQRAVGDGTGTDGNVYGTGIVVDSAETGIYVCGYGDAATDTLWVFKYNASGTLQWKRDITASTTLTALAIDVDGSDDPIVSGQNDFDTSSTAQVAMKLNASDGTVAWALRLVDAEFTGVSTPRITEDPTSGDIYVATKGKAKTGEPSSVSRLTGTAVWRIDVSALAHGFIGPYYQTRLVYSEAASAISDNAGPASNTTTGILTESAGTFTADTTAEVDMEYYY